MNKKTFAVRMEWAKLLQRVSFEVDFQFLFIFQSESTAAWTTVLQRRKSFPIRWLDNLFKIDFNIWFRKFQTGQRFGFRNFKVLISELQTCQRFGLQKTSDKKYKYKKQINNLSTIYIKIKNKLLQANSTRKSSRISGGGLPTSMRCSNNLKIIFIYKFIII